MFLTLGLAFAAAAAAAEDHAPVNCSELTGLPGEEYDSVPIANAKNDHIFW